MPQQAPTSPNRARVMAGPLAAAVAIALGLWWFAPRDTTLPPFVRGGDQNLLLVTIGGLHADALGSDGGSAATPVLDRLAESGVRFTFAHAHAAATLPSHASILTGRYPFEHHVRDDDGFRLGPAPATLAEGARTKGLATGAFVGSAVLDRQSGLARGFQAYDSAERPAGEVVAAARAWIAGQGTPWFAWVHLPHGDLATIDRALEPLVALATSGARATTVIVTSDRGEGEENRGETAQGVSVHEAALRVPLILAQVGPGTPGRHAGVTSDAPVGHIDIMATAGAMLSFPIARDAPGHSLLDPEPTRSRALYFEAMSPMLRRGLPALRGTIVGTDKYIAFPEPELYDLAADPGEAHNLAGSDADRLERLKARLESFGDTIPTAQEVENARRHAQSPR